MRRQNSFLSPLGFALLIIFFTGLSLTIWRSGSLAFSPGELSAKSRPAISLEGFGSHADFEKECQRCHKPLETTQAELCITCHNSIAEQIVLQNGLHNKFEMVTRCADCHSDHRGREFDPLLDALDDFDHTITEFSLIWHQVGYDTRLLECDACHVIDQNFSVSLGRCEECHAAHDMEFMVQHEVDFGAKCLDCHDGEDRMVDFDHTATQFPMAGKHQSLRCADCHRDVHFQETPQDCVRCHAEPGIHLGVFELDCSACHTAEGWEPALLDSQPFDHAEQTAFSLARHAMDYAYQPLSCQECHQNDIHSIDLDTCEACHGDNDTSFIDEHLRVFGSSCLDCHDGVDRMSDFDHANFFPLDGRHADVECEACHKDSPDGKIFKGTPTECVQCHAEPDVHAGFFGLQCQYCHTVSTWLPAKLQIHNYPLDHGSQGEVDCQVCHSTRYIEYTCYGCHDHEPQAIAESHARAEISVEELPECAKCHPVGVIEESGGG